MSSGHIRIISLIVVFSLLLTSCSGGVFQGSRGAQKAALAMAPKPPLDITGSHKPLPGVDAKNFDPPTPPLGPFSISRTLYPQVAAANGAQRGVLH